MRTDEELRSIIDRSTFDLVRRGLAEELLACREVLREVEWGERDDTPKFCPWCGGWVHVDADRKPLPAGVRARAGGPGHEPGCELKARIP